MKAIVEWLEAERARQGNRRLPPARLAALPAALLGLPDPDPLLRRLRAGPRARRRAARPPARGRGLPAEGPLAARRGGGLGAHDLPAAAAATPGARRTRWTRSSTPPGTSCATPTRANDDGAVRPRARRLLAAGPPVHRRRRARDPAPALRALLHEGHERPRAARLPRAVPAALHAGDDPLPRREDVQVEGQRRLARTRWSQRYGADADAPLHPLHGPGRGGQGVAGHRHRGHARACSTGSGGSGSRSRSAGRWTARPDGRARADRAPDDRRRSPTTSSAGSSSTRRSRRSSSSSTRSTA